MDEKYILRRNKLMQSVNSLIIEKNCQFDIVDGITTGQGILANRYLMLIALLYTKEEHSNFFSIDLSITPEERQLFLNNEFGKKKKAENVLSDAYNFYFELTKNEQLKDEIVGSIRL